MAQALGLAHHVLHGGAATPGLYGAAHAHAHEAGQPCPAGHEAWVDYFADHEAGGAECRLIDALAGGDALPSQACALPAVAALPAERPAQRAAPAPVPAAAPYEARAPPQG